MTHSHERSSDAALEAAGVAPVAEVGERAALWSPEYVTEEIFRGSRLVKIRHAGQEYRLLITRNNRLILQK